MAYSAQVERALFVCLNAHNGQYRKGGSGVPYSVHPIHMALILTRAGLREALIQAALLHDVVEDCADWTLDRLRDEFGEEVAAIVAELTEDKSKTWEERKRWAIDHVALMTTDGVIVKAADKLHNLESLAAQLAESMDTREVWMHFKGGRERTLELDGELVTTLQARAPEPLAGLLRSAFERVQRLA